jgi:SAM-dependent methyltransferase
VRLRPASPDAVIASPNIWRWPHLYELENRAQDADDAIFPALRGICDWAGRNVVDVGCGSGFHLARFASDARAVAGIEPHLPLVAAARKRLQHLRNVTVTRGEAQRLPLPDAWADLVHARTAYFFGPGCAPGIAEALRVLRPGGALVVVDLDATAHCYGEWMLADLPHYRPAQVEAFFEQAGFSLMRVDTRWRFESRADLQAVLGIEFSPKTAARAVRTTAGLSFNVRYRLHSLRKQLAPR